MTNIRFFVRLAVIAQDIYKGLSSALREQSVQNFMVCPEVILRTFQTA